MNSYTLDNIQTDYAYKNSWKQFDDKGLVIDIQAFLNSNQEKVNYPHIH